LECPARPLSVYVAGRWQRGTIVDVDASGALVVRTRAGTSAAITSSAHVRAS
jgi:hypothetical protein